VLALFGLPAAFLAHVVRLILGGLRSLDRTLVSGSAARVVPQLLVRGQSIEIVLRFVGLAGGDSWLVGQQDRLHCLKK